MENQTAVVESSPTETQDAFNGENVSFADFNHFRETGELPERFKPAEPVGTTPAEEIPEGEQPESVPESEPEQQQERKKGKTAEDRIAQLEATIEKIRRGAGIERKTEPAPVAEPPQQPQSYADYRKTFKPSQWVEQYGKANPDASYEDATAAMADHLADVRDQFRSIEQQRQSQAKELNEKVTEARARYGDTFDEVLAPTVTAILGDRGISPEVKELINDSPVVADLMFILGSDDGKALADLRSMPKTQAIRYVAALESGIVEEHANSAKQSETPRDNEGKFTAAPAKPKTSAPKPPVPVSGASSGAFDVSDESLSPEEWARKRTADLARRKG